eukprot:1155907-Pelagomonas_calceolata.AAC.1
MGVIAAPNEQIIIRVMWKNTSLPRPLGAKDYRRIVSGCMKGSSTSACTQHLCGARTAALEKASAETKSRLPVRLAHLCEAWAAVAGDCAAIGHQSGHPFPVVFHQIAILQLRQERPFRQLVPFTHVVRGPDLPPLCTIWTGQMIVGGFRNRWRAYD